MGQKDGSRVESTAPSSREPEGHTDLSGFYCNPRGQGDVWACAVAGDYFWVRGPIKAGVHLMSVVHITTQIHVDAYGLGGHQKLC